MHGFLSDHFYRWLVKSLYNGSVLEGLTQVPDDLPVISVGAENRDFSEWEHRIDVS